MPVGAARGVWLSGARAPHGGRTLAAVAVRGHGSSLYPHPDQVRSSRIRAAGSAPGDDRRNKGADTYPLSRKGNKRQRTRDPFAFPDDDPFAFPGEQTLTQTLNMALTLTLTLTLALALSGQLLSKKSKQKRQKRKKSNPTLPGACAKFLIYCMHCTQRAGDLHFSQDKRAAGASVGPG